MCVVFGSLQPALAHKYSRVRIAVLEALEPLVSCGAAECIRDLAAFRESNVINLETFFTGCVRHSVRDSVLVAIGWLCLFIQRSVLACQELPRLTYRAMF